MKCSIYTVRFAVFGAAIPHLTHDLRLPALGGQGGTLAIQWL
jgi:hypothetical protein